LDSLLDSVIIDNLALICGGVAGILSLVANVLVAVRDLVVSSTEVIWRAIRGEALTVRQEPRWR